MNLDLDLVFKVQVALRNFLKNGSVQLYVRGPHFEAKLGRLKV
jgi:hypothetical protein